jgi:cis-3-alkyl-4-acyloxetan-2-one decarboxylase
MPDFSALYPFVSHWLDLDGVRYHYLDQGPTDAPPVVMLHGNPTWSFAFRTLIPEISERYRVIVPDHVGCGLSDKPQDYAYTLDQHIRNVEQLIDALGLHDVTLLLHDWGGAIGMGYATRHPQNVARLVILNTAAFYQPNLPRRIKMCRIPILGDVLLRGFNAFARLALPWATFHRERLTPEVRAGYLAPYNSWQNRIAILRFVQDIPLEPRHRSRKTLDAIEDGLSLLVDRPMLIIWGARDFCFTVRDYLTGWQARFPAAETHVVEDAGHYIVEDAHERIVPWVLSFLDASTSQLPEKPGF